MDPITAAIVAALTAGLAETGKTAITDAYQSLKGLLAKKFGLKSQIVQAVDHLEARPESANRQGGLAEELIAVQAEQDNEILAAAKHLLTLAQPQQVVTNTYTVQNSGSGPVQAQIIGGNGNAITQQGIRELPKA